MQSQSGGANVVRLNDTRIQTLKIGRGQKVFNKGILERKHDQPPLNGQAVPIVGFETVEASGVSHFLIGRILCQNLGDEL